MAVSNVAIKQIDATKGSIGGWTIQEDYLSSGEGTYLNSNGTFYFLPPNANGNLCAFVNLGNGAYNFYLGEKTRFQLGSTSITESDLKKLLALI